MRNLFSLFAVVLMLTSSSCVSKKKYLELQGENADIQQRLDDLRAELSACETAKAEIDRHLNDVRTQLAGRETDLQNKDSQMEQLKEQLEFLQRSNTNLLDRLSDLSVISKSGAESIKQSLEALNEQNKYIQDLTSSIQRKDSLNLALVMNLKRSLSDVNDEDIQVEVRKGVVYVSISDKLLFRSGSSEITSRAVEVLGKVARVINDHNEIEILVEGHTDSVPIKTECLQDNWDLSVKRATSVVRLLQDRYSVDPQRMIAGGRGEFVPKADNNSSAGRQENRRTEIIITPRLDQFFELLQAPAADGN